MVFCLLSKTIAGKASQIKEIGSAERVMGKRPLKCSCVPPIGGSLLNIAPPLCGKQCSHSTSAVQEDSWVGPFTRYPFTRALYTMFCVLVFFAFPLVVSSDSCKTLDGTWYNQLGSEVILKHHSDGKLVGEYRTAAERHAGAAGQQHSTVLGKLN